MDLQKPCSLAEHNNNGFSKIMKNMFGYNRVFSLLLTLFLLSFYATLYNIIFRLKRGGLQILTLISSHAFENELI